MSKDKQVQPDCANHKKDLFGETDMKKVAEAIGDLHYETLVDLAEQLKSKLLRDSWADRMAGRKKLGDALEAASKQIAIARVYLFDALVISKQFMNQKP